MEDIKKDQDALDSILKKAVQESSYASELEELRVVLSKTINPTRLDSMKAARKALRTMRHENIEARSELIQWIKQADNDNYDRYNSFLYSQSEESALRVERIDPVFSDSSPIVDGREVLQKCFDAALQRDPRVLAFGEDVGKIGDVNQGFAGLQQKHGELRVTDTGIRECTIIGQGIGLALRGLRPIAEISISIT
jgi:Pyruvate/2-oxoglutarate dehydrogenase complex, dehydrogenase (E1) component, eukaryotic type, beta subunit